MNPSPESQEALGPLKARVSESDLLQALMSSSVDHIYFKDLQCRFLAINAKMANIFLLSDAREAIGKTDFDYFTPEHAQLAFDDEQSIIATGAPIINKEEKETWPDGRLTWVTSSKMPLRNESGEIVGTFGISRDITAVKEAEIKIQEINRQLIATSRQAGMAEVATNILHNVGNILNSANLSTSIIVESVKNSKSGRLKDVAKLIDDHADDLPAFLTQDYRGRQLPKYISELAGRLASERSQLMEEARALADSIQHIKEIVSLQQDYAKISSPREPISLEEIVKDAVRMHAGAFTRHGVQIVTEVEPSEKVLADKHKLLQILVNLLHNAKYACSFDGCERKRIKIKAGDDGEVIRIQVIDSGHGIAPENINRIFNHGFTTRPGGHGFGLHSSALAAKELGGRLTAHSEGTNKGAAFTLELPRTPR